MGSLSWIHRGIGPIDTTSASRIPRGVLRLMIPIPVGIKVSLWSNNLLSLVNDCFLMIVSGSWIVDTSTLNLMFVVWNHSSSLPYWVINSREWSWFRSSWSWSNWINTDSWSTTWLWAFASGNNCIGKIISERNVITWWLVIKRIFKIWLALISR